MVDRKENALSEEAEKTFWQRFFIHCLFFLAGGFLAYTVTGSLFEWIYGWASRPTIVVQRQPVGKDCMEGKPAKVIKQTREVIYFGSDNSIITLQRGNQPSFICQFDGELLYFNWNVGDVVYHDGGTRL